MEITFGRLISRLDTTKERISELTDLSIEVPEKRKQNEQNATEYPRIVI